MGYTENGIKFFEWENTKDLTLFAGLNSTEITSKLSASDFLQKWVD